MDRAVNRSVRLPISAILATMLGAACTVGAQQIFRSGTDTVLLSVAVTDGKIRAVTGLTEKDFQVVEDGVPQTISVFARDPQPIALSLLIDSSSSMSSKIGVAQEAATSFARRLRTGDEAQVINFNTHTQVSQTFTSDALSLERAIRSIRPEGSTSLYDAIYIALTELGRKGADTPAGAIRRQAIILLSDGQDTNSLNKYDDVIDMAKRSIVTIYAIGLQDPDERSRHAPFNESDFALRSLAQVTGGRAFFVTDISQLGTIYTQIGDELNNQYILGYVSKNDTEDGAWRQVNVRVNQPDTTARTKTGYFARGRSRSAS
jgi:Ca-activated chloride channel family protein